MGTTRYTRKDAEQAVRRLAKALNRPYGHYITVDEEPLSFEGEQPEGRYKVQRGNGTWITTQPGALELDYNPTYGGCVIEEIAPTGATWISQPFSRSRKSPREFCDYVSGLIQGIDQGLKLGSS